MGRRASVGDVRREKGEIGAWLAPELLCPSSLLLPPLRARHPPSPGSGRGLHRHPHTGGYKESYITVGLNFGGGKRGPTAARDENCTDPRGRRRKGDFCASGRCQNILVPCAAALLREKNGMFHRLFGL
ncbi:hypothetical protein CALVIDRAFT_108195 [Calocera viscosa TUFC12733]|uniref:Uncharacterized protein n=1 Tax=Calocera viscosa (strain TUFC12733) TaxID=1330018 RepID=A0A167MD75_CALVF|nr:hypothetical protein CALVIDRAFT_108195 [Calocera viscosa TUFC12733]